MTSKLNVDLAKRRGLPKQDIKYLKALHYAMDAMVAQYNGRLLSEKEVKRLSKRVQDMEFLMQDIWEFDPNEFRHYHWKRFDALLMEAIEE